MRYYRDVMGATITHEPFDLEEQGVKVCFVDTPGENGTNGTQIELIEPLGEQSTLTGFLAKNPAGGQHHVCYEVEDIEDARQWFEGLGKRILGPTRIGAHGADLLPAPQGHDGPADRDHGNAQGRRALVELGVGKSDRALPTFSSPPRRRGSSPTLRD